MDLTKATIFSNLIPVYTIGFAFWLLDESLTSSQLMQPRLRLPAVKRGPVVAEAETDAVHESRWVTHENRAAR